jgi:hypothetical protein
MDIKAILLVSTAFLAISATAFAADKETYQADTKIEKDSDGNYTETNKTVKTDVDGTINSSERNLTVAVDAKGNIDKSRTTKHVTDPKGLGNKHVTTTKDTETTKYGQVTSTHAKTVNGKSVEGSETNSQSDSQGNYEQMDITTKTDAAGTTTKVVKETDVKVSANGDTDKSTSTKKMVDPKGLLNKTTVQTSNTEQVKDGIIKASHEIKVNGKTVESTTETAPAR